MEIDKKKCIGCGNCHAVCTMGVIYLDEDGKSVVNQDECVECYTCYRVLCNEGYHPWFVRTIRKILSLFRLGYLAEVDVCPTGDLNPPELKWPRSIRAVFSDPSTVHPSTGVPGRGTDEIKSNDVTGRLRKGEVGLVIEGPAAGKGDLNIQYHVRAWNGLLQSYPKNDRLIGYVKLQRLTPRKAAKIMAKCCECEAFNPVRAEMLLEKIRKGDREDRVMGKWGDREMGRI
jgi:ferredoxin